VNKSIKNWKEAVEKDSSEPEKSHTIATSSKLTSFLQKAAGIFTLARTGDDQIAIRIARNLFHDRRLLGQNCERHESYDAFGKREEQQ
jgi:hypothetical protein